MLHTEYPLSRKCCSIDVKLPPVSRHLSFSSYVFVLSGRRPVMKLFRDGPHIAIWQCARVNVWEPVAAMSASMLGVYIWGRGAAGQPPSSGRKSSTMIINTFLNWAPHVSLPPPNHNNNQTGTTSMRSKSSKGARRWQRQRIFYALAVSRCSPGSTTRRGRETKK